MADGTGTKSWQKFIAELKKEGMDFADIQHADEKTRAQLLEAMSTLSAIDRASITTTWKRLAEKDKTTTATSGTDSSTPSRDPAPVQKDRGGSMARGGDKRASDSSFFGPSIQSSTFEPVQDYVPPQLVRNASGGSPRIQPPVLNVPVMNMGVGGGDLAALLRTALDRGDCGTALPLASEMLQSDPIGLVYMLNEYLPQLSVEQLKTILGVGGAAGGGPEGLSPRDTKEYSPSSGRGLSPARQSSISPRSGRGGQSAYDDRSPGVEMSVQPTLNGQPLTAGQVLTAHSIQAQYGARFTATCNGRTLIFPYCVQRGDRIIVRSAQDRLL